MPTTTTARTAFVLVYVLLLIVLRVVFIIAAVYVLKPWSDRFQFAFRKFFISNCSAISQKNSNRNLKRFFFLYCYFTNWKLIVPLYSTQKRVIGFS